ncbi:MAG: radical SAM protein [Candidatus Omnitrophica bacterium]|nr:radical SAM protein [Candidatus Omnitrophota bacterium]
MNLPYLVFSDKKGKIYHHPYLRMSVSSLDKVSLPKEEELIKLPPGSAFFYLPQRQAIGFDPETKKFEVLNKLEEKEVFAVSVFPIPAFLRLYNPACITKTKKALPLWAYTACGYYKGNFYIAAKRIDKRVRQSPRFYDQKLISKQVRSFLKAYPDNRLYRHLANCALNYNCLAAKNLFLQRWEAPLPTARTCNARCLGCLSYQESDCASSHQRINFKPKVDEVAEIMINHLRVAREAIVSFGQGCEGEPLLESDLIAKSIIKVRENTARGTINMNTNASVPKRIEMLCQAGMDSFRISLNSSDEKFYNLYFRPKGYKFSDLIKSIAIAKKYKKFVSINLFVFPGFSDSSQQIKSLVSFIKKTGVDMIQWRNLNIDPDYYLKHMPYKKLKSQGILYLIDTIKKEFPSLKHGYFNLPKESF